MKKMFMFLAAFAVFFLGVQASFACSCMTPKAPLKAMEDYDNVYIATVSSVQTNAVTNKKSVALDMLEVFKGSNDDAKVSTADNSAACGFNFEKDESYIIYENNHDVALCSRTANVKNASEDLEALRKMKKEYDSKEVFEMIEGPVCEAATDGCNNIIMSDGKVAGMTQMYCENHTPKYSCTKYSDEKTYATKEAFIKAEGATCETATDGVNTFFGENFEASTRIGYPEDFIAEWKCIDEDKNDEEVTMCTMQYAPVCGVDGKTYSNDCMAGDVEIAHEGSCEAAVLSENDKNRLAALKKSLSTSYVATIEKVLTVYEAKLEKMSDADAKAMHEKVQKNVKKKQMEIALAHPQDTAMTGTTKVIYEIVSYLALRLKEIQL